MCDDACEPDYDIACNRMNDLQYKLRDLVQPILYPTVRPLSKEFHLMTQRFTYGPRPWRVMFSSNDDFQSTANMYSMILTMVNWEVVLSSDVIIPEWNRGMGIGQNLLMARVRACREVGFKHYICSVALSNQVQHHILTKHGFKQLDGQSKIWSLDL